MKRCWIVDAPDATSQPRNGIENACGPDRYHVAYSRECECFEESGDIPIKDGWRWSPESTSARVVGPRGPTRKKLRPFLGLESDTLGPRIGPSVHSPSARIDPKSRTQTPGPDGESRRTGARERLRLSPPEFNIRMPCCSCFVFVRARLSSLMGTDLSI